MLVFWARLCDELDDGEVVAEDDTDEGDDELVEDEDKFCMENSVDLDACFGSGFCLSNLGVLEWGEWAPSDSNFLLRFSFDSGSELGGVRDSARLDGVSELFLS